MVLFHDESESPGSRTQRMGVCACVACVSQARHAKSEFFDIALVDPANTSDRSSYAPMECIRLLKAIAASLNRNSIGCPKFIFFSLAIFRN